MDKRQAAVEGLVIGSRVWKDRKVFLTGHTGFKGAWASLLLRRLGAEVHGFALPPESEAGLFVAAGVAGDIHHHVGDVRDFEALREALSAAQPSVVVHLAAQAMVRRSYAQPVETYSTNVMGTVHLLEAIRRVPSVMAVVIVTSDKCYEHSGAAKPFREADRLGGHDPYSSSKACAEIVADAYRNSFFSRTRPPHIATARAGNVIGGGDRGHDRLIPDAVRAFSNNEILQLRHPEAVRPWQHVLDPLLGYLLLCERLLENGGAYAEAWNFGPSEPSVTSAREVAEAFAQAWGGNARWQKAGGSHPREAALLQLDCAKAMSLLGWRPRLDLAQALRLTAEWYAAYRNGCDMRDVTLRQIDAALAPAAGGAQRAPELDPISVADGR